jgi:hypothetical protein
LSQSKQSTYPQFVQYKVASSSSHSSQTYLKFI